MSLDIDNLILSGAVEIAAIDAETGEFLYQFTPKLKEVEPELYKRHLQKMHEDVMLFWQKGFIHIDGMDGNDPKISLTDMAFDKNAIATLSQEEMYFLNEMKRVLKVV